MRGVHAAGLSSFSRTKAEGSRTEIQQSCLKLLRCALVNFSMQYQMMLLWNLLCLSVLTVRASGLLMRALRTRWTSQTLQPPLVQSSSTRKL